MNRLVPMRRWTFSSFSLGSLLEPSRLHAGGPQLVGGDLFLHEGGVGLVAIERLDHPIAIAPRGDEEVVGLEARGVGVAHQIEPGTAPALAVARRREKAIDQFFVGIGGLVVDELGPPVREWAEVRAGRNRRGGRRCRDRLRARDAGLAARASQG